ncbi:conserved hypothetical protein [Cellulomonas flavigena DSM 20109]|uniref:Uncharacterized protein n=2 Tax=Cellulomonas flavigena TaxID=1711 RepID=D5UI37_CELFN|nr:conserved hypothetical protein [Cellulomonas flavigena DSM 20109]
MRRTPALPSLAAATVVALALAGCTGGTSSASAEDGGPMTAFYEKLGGSFEDEDYERQQREMEEIIAACMAEQGFEYTPAEPVSMEEPEGLPEWDSKEYAEQYGYGATTSDEIYGGGEEYVDPNADYLATMSESEQTAFYEALYGTPPEVDPEADPEAEIEYNWEENGCSGKASHEVYEQQGGIWEDPEFTALSDEMSTEWEAVLDDPKVSAAQDKWVECIADAGFDFSSPDEPQQAIYDELNALYEAAAPDAEGDVEGEVDPEASFEPDPAAMAELKEKELELAAADYACKESSGFTKAQNDAYAAIEQQMWDKYGERLEAIAAKYESEK